MLGNGNNGDNSLSLIVDKIIQDNIKNGHTKPNFFESLANKIIMDNRIKQQNDDLKFLENVDNKNLNNVDIMTNIDKK